jgi:glutamine amidotransferase
MTGGKRAITATFWLLQAPDSLSVQSHPNPDGTGLGAFTAAGEPIVSKQPLAAYADEEFAREAKELVSRTFIAHVRYATTGAVLAQNTHPFEQAGRLFAHNGMLGGLDQLEARLGDERSLVHGDTDSERYFALVTQEIAGGKPVGDAIAAAAGWIAANLPVYALNCIVITASELWALRYPDTHELHVLERAAGGPDGESSLEQAGAAHELRVSSQHLADRPAVVVASEPMDDDPGWRALNSGELLHVDSDLNVSIQPVLNEPPTHPLTPPAH